jgi:hypothetical protein
MDYVICDRHHQRYTSTTTSSDGRTWRHHPIANGSCGYTELRLTKVPGTHAACGRHHDKVIAFWRGRTAYHHNCPECSIALTHQPN